MSAPVFGALDVLGLGSDWEPQGSTPSNAPTHAEATGSDGDVIAEKAHRNMETGTAQYIYIGAETGFIAALASAWPGKLVDTDTLQITTVAIDYAPCAAGQRPMVTFTYRDGPTDDPPTPFWYATDLTLPTYVAANVDVPTILTVTAGDAEVQTASWQLDCQVGEDLDKDGEYLASQAYKGQEQISLQFVGTPTSITSTGWIQTAGPGVNTGETKVNTGYGTAPYTFVRKVTRSTGA